MKGILQMRYVSTAEQVQVRKLKEAIADWIAENDFTIFGTLNYYNAKNIRLNKAHKDAATFMRKLNLTILGKHKVDRLNTYFNSITFVERGRNRDNTHIHFFIKGETLQDEKDISYYAYRIWNKANIINANNVVLKDEAYAQRRSYCLKEQQALDDLILCTNACNVSLSTTNKALVKAA